MHGNSWLVVLIITVMLGAVWTSTKTIATIYNYIQLTARVAPDTIEWSVVAQDSEHYFPHATYTYRVADNTYSGATTLPAPAARNLWAAKQLLPEIVQQQWPVWYSPADPASATLYHDFPLKATLYGALMWLLVAYFIGLAYYLRWR